MQSLNARRLRVYEHYQDMSALYNGISTDVPSEAASTQLGTPGSEIATHELAPVVCLTIFQ
jgi:hypothetical protein